MNKKIEMGNVTAVIARSAEHKETLIAGEDFFYVDTASLHKIFTNHDGYWAIIKRSPNYVVARRDNKRREIRLSRLLTDVVDDRTLVVAFANECFYDLRMKNLLVGSIGDRDWIQEQRKMVLPELEDLPKEIKNDLVERNGSSEPQGPITANVLKINRTVKFEVEIGNGIKLQYCPSTIDEEEQAVEAMRFLADKFTVVLP
ncbi:hypothetical protein [Bacillus badius]|uniref:Phage protein n=1 Tax=Bacillus badius TaxID=1455 RepID=A0ABR5AZH8_BACBA|nr:hypothetical protein [Bacillus badius]KIL80155.1 hypothetical protein SD77_0003 [Bacillus badius]MED4718403.1 hypothetical protein [Bacillus badius]